MLKKSDLFFIGFVLALFALNVKYFTVDGHDFKIYTAAAEVYRQGLDPYLVKNIARQSGTRLSFVYPPLTLLFFAFASRFDYISFYVAVWSLMLVLAFFIARAADKEPDTLFLAAVFLTGFRAAYWNLATGNVDLTGLLLFSLVYFFLKKDRTEVSASFVSLAAFLKIFPIFYGLPFLLPRLSNKRTARMALFWLTPFILLSLASYAMFREITPSYYMAVTGRIEGQHTPVAEGGGATNPAAIFFFRHLCLLLFRSEGAYPYLFFLFAIAVMAVAYTVIRRAQDEPVKVLSFWMLAFSLVFPRLKPYSFAYLLPAVYFLSKDWGRAEKALVLFLVSFVPLAGFILPSRYWDYNELIGLLSFFLLCVYKERKGYAAEAAANPRPQARTG